MANEIEKLKVELLDSELVALADKIVQVIEDGKQALAEDNNDEVLAKLKQIEEKLDELTKK